MPYLAQAVDAIEPVSDTDWEIVANSANYNVVSGCAATYSAVNMTKTIAAGIVTHNGSVITVAGNTVTLISDPSNPRWTWTGINSSGVAVIVSGDPLATPLVPELGDLVAVSLDLVQYGQTIANNVVTQIEKRIMAPIFATQGAVLTAASTLPVVKQNHHVTGGTTITALPAFPAGMVVVLAFDGATPITYNGTSLILIGGASITTVAGETHTFVSEGSGNWREIATSAPASVVAITGLTNKYKGNALGAQTISASTTFVDVSATGSSTFSFTPLVNEVSLVEIVLNMTFTGTGGFKMQFTGPASPTRVDINALYGVNASDAVGPASLLSTAFPPNIESSLGTAFSTPFGVHAAGTTGGLYTTTSPTFGTANWPIHIWALIANGSTSSVVTLQAAQNSANGTAVIGIGSWMTARRMA